MNIPAAISIDHLTKYYGKRCLIDDVSLTVAPGTIYGFLGRNGMGKTTLIRTFLGLEDPTRGNSSVLGEASTTLRPETRARIGYLPEGHHVYGWMTVQECAKFQSSFYPKWNADIFHAVISHFRLKPKMRAGFLSRGQRAGLCLALTLAPEPELLVLDDPALGLDSVARRSLLQSMIYVTRQTARTIFFSSHILADVERVADRIAVFDQGVIRADCTVDTFRQSIKQFVLKFGDTPPPAPALPGILQSFRTDRELTVTLVNPPGDIEIRLAALQPKNLESIPLTLEDAFINYVDERGEKTFFMNQKETK